MRVISGKYKGNVIKGFDINGTRPTMDRVKESLFAVIQNDTFGVCLDLFSGSGNLGIEALSNGCRECYFVDNNKVAIDVINENIKKLNITEVTHTLKMDYKEAIKYFENNQIKFDLVFLDPPYKDKILNEIIRDIYELVNMNGVVVLEYENDDIKECGYKLIKTKKYGAKYVTFLRKDK